MPVAWSAKTIRDSSSDETPEGDFWLPQRDDVWSLAVVLAEQEQEMYGHAGSLCVRPGDVVIDGGAHVGLFTRTALAAGASKVVTFEVTPKALLCLRRNLAKEIAEGKVVVVDKGVWHEEATLPLVIVDGCSVCNSVTHQMPAAVDVPLTTIDHAAEALKLARVDFIKLDIENAEANALRGAAQTLRRFHPRVAVALENAKNRCTITPMKSSGSCTTRSPAMPTSAAPAPIPNRAAASCRRSSTSTRGDSADGRASMRPVAIPARLPVNRRYPDASRSSCFPRLLRCGCTRCVRVHAIANPVRARGQSLRRRERYARIHPRAQADDRGHRADHRRRAGGAHREGASS